MRTYLIIPMGVKDWPTDDPKIAAKMARRVRDQVKQFITENKLDAMAILANTDKVAQKSGGDPEVHEKINVYMKELFEGLAQ